MKLIILSLIISISLHLLIFTDYPITKIEKVMNNDDKNIKKANVTFVKIKKEIKKDTRAGYQTKKEIKKRYLCRLSNKKKEIKKVHHRL